MDLNLVILQLREFCPLLEGRVAGAADFDTGVETVMAITDPGTGRLAYPSAAVIPLEDDATGNDALDGNYQVVTETIGVIVEFDSTADRRGQAGVSQVEAMKYALFRALLSWRIDPAKSSKGLYYAGGELITFDRARLFWEFRFSFDALISDADGFTPCGDPLVVIEATLPVNPPEDDTPAPTSPTIEIQVTAPVAPPAPPRLGVHPNPNRGR
jgi:hypothetical protein